MCTDETGGSDVGVSPTCGGVEVGGIAILPAPVVWKVGQVSSETAEAPDYRCAVWRQYPCPDATVGVLTAPLKGSRYSSRCKCTWCSLTDSHPLIA